MNWKSEALEKLRRYDAMQLATINIPMELKRLSLDAEAIRSARTDTISVSCGNHREDALINNLIHRQELENTLQQVRLWLNSTDKAMSLLTRDEKLILHRLFIHPQTGAIEQLCKDLQIEQSTLYRKRDHALRRFILAFYGISEA